MSCLGCLPQESQVRGKCPFILRNTSAHTTNDAIPLLSPWIQYIVISVIGLVLFISCIKSNAQPLHLMRQPVGPRTFLVL